VAICDSRLLWLQTACSLVYAREPQIRVLAVDADHYFRKPVSATFHGRDVFAPVAGALAKGIDPLTFGPQIKDYVRFALPPVRKTGDKAIEGIVLHIDRFGNVITNITPGTIAPLAQTRSRAFSR
jgi:S-adenosylmethionine hydrolase